MSERRCSGRGLVVCIDTQTASRLGTVAALLVSIVSCGRGESANLTGPDPTRPPPFDGSGNIVGRVVDATAGYRAVPNLRLRVFGADDDSAVRAVELPDVVTDGNGRYKIARGTNLVLFFATAPGSDHRFLCDRYPLNTTAIWPDGSSPFTDLVVVPSSWSSVTVPPGMILIGTSVYGTVAERVDGTLHPVPGATVALESGLHDPPATTDAAGFFMICSLTGTDQTRTITARKTGYRRTEREFFAGWDHVVDLELARE